MSPVASIPAPDVLPVPSPIWLLNVLLHLTFVLHTLAMNLMVGGSLIALVESLRSGETSRRITAAAGRWMPILVAATVTIGVAPLLFLQTIYGHLFYTSSVLMAWPWFLVIPILLVTYYLVYAVSFRGEGAGPAWPLRALIVAGLLAIAFIYTNNMTLALRPEKWQGLYAASAAGRHLNLDEPMLWPRYLHTLLAAVAVAGMALCLWAAGSWEADRDRARSLLRTGALWFAVPTGVQFVVGFWYLMVQPRAILMRFMGASSVATLLLMGTVLTGLASVILLTISLGQARPRRWIGTSAGLLVVTVVGMILVRDTVRRAMLEGVFRPEELTIAPQTGVILLFVALLVAGLATVGWMVRALARGPTTAPAREGP